MLSSSLPELGYCLTSVVPVAWLVLGQLVLKVKSNYMAGERERRRNKRMTGISQI